MADGAPPPVTEPEAEKLPDGQIPSTSPGIFEPYGGDVDCTGEVSSITHYDYVLPSIDADGRGRHRDNPDTPARIAKKWALRAPESNPDWDRDSPPVATFAYDREPAREARQVRIDFTTTEGALIAYLVADRHDGSGWLLGSALSC